MEITTRSLWTLIHGMGFGALYLLGCSGVLVELWRRYLPAATAPITTRTSASCVSTCWPWPCWRGSRC